MAATALVTAILALEVKLLPDEIVLVTDLVNKIKAHKKPKIAIAAATGAVDSVPNDADYGDPTDNPYSPNFLEK